MIRGFWKWEDIENHHEVRIWKFDPKSSKFKKIGISLCGVKILYFARYYLFNIFEYSYLFYVQISRHFLSPYFIIFRLFHCNIRRGRCFNILRLWVLFERKCIKNVDFVAYSIVNCFDQRILNLGQCPILKWP